MSNVQTKESGLNTNVMATRKAMISFLEEKYGKPMIRIGAPIYMTAYMEKLFLHICNLAIKTMDKKETKLSYKTVQQAIKNDETLMGMFVADLYTYDKEDCYEFSVFDGQEYTSLLQTINKN